MTCNRNVTLEPVMGIDWTNARVTLRTVAGKQQHTVSSIYC